MKQVRIDDRGVALTVAIFITAILLTITGAGLFFSQMDLKMSGSDKLSKQAFGVAESGIYHSLTLIPAGNNFEYLVPTPLINSAGLASMPSFTYSVDAVNTAGNTRAILTSTSQGPQNSQKIIVAYVARGGYGLGAIHVPGGAQYIETQFGGVDFRINGNDNCSQASPVPGISVTDPALVTEMTNDSLLDGGLDADQMNNVTGGGGSPSIRVTPPTDNMISDLVNSFMNPPNTPIQLPAGDYGGGAQWGTALQPRITVVNGSASIAGNVSGYGVLIVEGGLSVFQGNFTFTGLVIARGDVAVDIGGSASINGAVLLQESSEYDPTIELNVRGSAEVRFDSCALAAAGGWADLPLAPTIVAWQEKLSS